MLRKVLPVALLTMAVVLGCRSQPATTGEALPIAGAPGTWGASLPDALQRAQSSGKPVVVDFFATWCEPCKMLEETWADSRVQSALTRFITVKIDVDQQQQVAEQYKVQSVPTIVFLGPGGEETHRQVGYMTAHEMRKLLDENG